MSSITLLIILGSVVSTAIFVAGYRRGVHNAFSGYGIEETEQPVPQDGHWGGILLALLGSIVVITAMGFSSAWIYAGPILCLVTTIGVGVAFFIERQTPSKG
ncbi:hypothetical protein [Methylorubrum thiocyanatum]